MGSNRPTHASILEW